MQYPKPTIARWRLRGIVLMMVLAVTAIVVPPLSQAETTGATVGKYLGRWNYDQPNHDTMINITTSDAPGRDRVPTIGDIVFTAESAGRVVGRTDVGCTWRFKATRDSLELDPSSQLCHNPTSNVAYTINQWTVIVKGGREQETIVARSHRPGDRDYDFLLEKGARTKANEYDPDATKKFAGAWTYDPAEREAGVNIRTTVRIAPDGSRTVEATEEQGTVTITKDYSNRVTARTDDGCTWSLVARGNTAKLDPAIQTCTRSASSAITIRHWTIVTDGRQQASVVTGTDERGGSFVVNEGSLSRG